MSQRTTEEYLETIGALQERENPVSTSAIAQGMGVALASVSEMLRRLSDKGLVLHTPYGGASLTEDGQKKYLHLTRRHRLWEVFLHQHLGLGWEDVYEQACALEHSTSDLVADRLSEFLDHPKVCPHGSPIPDRNLNYSPVSHVTLGDLEPGQTATITSIIIERDAEFLRYLSGIGVVPGTCVSVSEKAAVDGTLTISINGDMKAIGRDPASMIMVKVES
jgi:DtxR family transcriptional regulator, Mn-dependent transcriptional regulator